MANAISPATLTLDGAPRAIEAAVLNLHIATEAWVPGKKSWFSQQAGAWLYGADHLSAAWFLEVTVDDHSGDDGYPAPSLSMPIDPQSFPSALDGLGGLAMIDPDDGSFSAHYGNDAPHLSNSRFVFERWIGRDQIAVRWTARYEEREGDGKRRMADFLFVGPVTFEGITMRVKDEADAAPFLAHALPTLDTSDLQLTWDPWTEYPGTTLPPDRRRWRKGTWARLPQA